MFRWALIATTTMVLAGCDNSSESTQGNSGKQAPSTPQVAMVSLDALSGMALENHRAAMEVKATCAKDLPYDLQALEQMAKVMNSLSLGRQYTVSDFEGLADQAKVAKKVKMACDQNEKAKGWNLPEDTRHSNVMASTGLTLNNEISRKPESDWTLREFPSHVGSLYACAVRISDEKLSEVANKFAPMIDEYRALVTGKGEVIDPIAYAQYSEWPEETRKKFSTVTLNEPATWVIGTAALRLGVHGPGDGGCRDRMPYLMSQLPTVFEHTKTAINNLGS